MQYAGVYAYGVPADLETRRGLIFRGHVMNLYGSITVGPDGARFVNDDLSSTSVFDAMAARGYRRVYQVATSRQLEKFLAKDPIQVIGWDRNRFPAEMREQVQFICRADSVAELAAKMHLALERLEATVRRYNAMVEAGRDADFGRRYMDGKIDQGPFYGFHCQPVAGISVGGLKVDRNLTVLLEDGSPIPRLLAAGEVVGGLHGSSYIGGSSLGGALTLGMVAGRLASAF